MNYNEKQLEIITVAEKLFSVKGYAGTSVREIAESAGVNIAMISYYFNSKEKLMEAIFAVRTGHSTEKLEKLLQDHTLMPIEKLEILVDDYIQKVFDQHIFYKLMYFEQMLDQNPAINKMLLQLKRKNAELIIKLIEDGQQKGVFKADIDIPFLIQTMVGIIMHSCMNREYYRSIANLDHLSNDEFMIEYKSRLKKYVKDLIKLITNK